MSSALSFSPSAHCVETDWCPEHLVSQCIVVIEKARTFCKMADGPNEFQLEQPPTDGISSVKFSPKSASFLVVSSWDTVSFFSRYLHLLVNVLINSPCTVPGTPKDRFLLNAFKRCFRLSGVLLKLCRLILGCAKKNFTCSVILGELEYSRIY